MATLTSEAIRRFYEITDEMRDVMVAKNKDYGQFEDPFANLRSSGEWEVRPWVATMVRANDKIRRLQTYAKTGTLTNEGVRDGFIDLANYAILALLLWEDEANGVCDEGQSGSSSGGSFVSGPSEEESDETGFRPLLGCDVGPGPSSLDWDAIRSSIVWNVRPRLGSSAAPQVVDRVLYGTFCESPTTREEQGTTLSPTE